MTAHESHRPNSAERERAYWRDRLDAYVDGTLDEKLALRLHLFAEKDEEFGAELRARRAFFAHLAAMPQATPSGTFDDRVLASLPLAKYETAPRRPERVLVLGDDRVPLLERLFGRLRRGTLAAAAAYLLFLAVSHSKLAEGVASLSGWTSDALASLAARSAELPVLSTVVGFLSRAYDAGSGALASFAATVGEGLVTFVVGILFGALALALFAGSRRRAESRRWES